MKAIEIKSLSESIARGEYSALIRVLSRLDPSEIEDDIKAQVEAESGTPFDDLILVLGRTIDTLDETMERSVVDAMLTAQVKTDPSLEASLIEFATKYFEKEISSERSI